MQLIFALDVFGARHHHAGHESTKGADAVSFADTEHTGVNVGSTSLEGTEAVICQSVDHYVYKVGG